MIVLMGVSGAGKGTQGRLLAQRLAYVYLAMGDLLRAHATPEQQARMLEGELLDDEEAIAILGAALEDQADKNAVILDGFPRTLRQATWLLHFAAAAHASLEAILDLEVTAEVVRERLHHRHREDDTEEAMAHRIRWHKQNVQELQTFYREHHIPLYEVDGGASVEAVQRQMLALLKPVGVQVENAH